MTPGPGLSRAANLGLGAFLALALWLPGGVLAGEEFQVRELNFQNRGDWLMLNARIDYRFSEVASEALDHGVPMTLAVHVQLRPARAWVWTESLSDQRLRYVIRYKPLSEHYVVGRFGATGGHSYVTRSAAIAALGEVRDLPLVRLDELAADTAYEVHLRASLDIEELPLPLKPMAYLLPSWKLSTGWTKWPLPR